MFDKLDEDLFTKDLIIKTLDVLCDAQSVKTGYLELLRYDITKAQYTELMRVFMEAAKAGRGITFEEVARKFGEIRGLNQELYEPVISEILRKQTADLLEGMRNDGILVNVINELLPEE